MKISKNGRKKNPENDYLTAVFFGFYKHLLSINGIEDFICNYMTKNRYESLKKILISDKKSKGRNIT